MLFQLSPASNDVFCIGNAIVDTLANCDDAFLTQHKIAKGNMSLIDQPRASELLLAIKKMGETPRTISGGSAANTAVGISALGGATSFFGKLADDENGALYRSDLTAQKVKFYTSKEHIAAPSATSIIFVTPDGERSMNTYLGATGDVFEGDIENTPITGSKITYIEGYLWNAAHAKKAIIAACHAAHEAGNHTALTLSDTFCVDMHREEFLTLLADGVIDIVFANEDEAKALYQTDDLSLALDKLRGACPLSAVTMGGNGCVGQSADERVEVNAFAIDDLVDTTGAGDMFAAGFLRAMTAGKTLEQCCKLGNFAASKIVQELGPRATCDLQKLAEAEQLI